MLCPAYKNNAAAIQICNLSALASWLHFHVTLLVPSSQFPRCVYSLRWFSGCHLNSHEVFAFEVIQVIFEMANYSLGGWLLWQHISLFFSKKMLPD